MLSSVLAYAYPGECARLMVTHPGIEVYAPLVAVASLGLVWALVWLLVRGRFAATVSALVLVSLPAFRLGLFHPFSRNYKLAIVLLALVAIVGVYRIFRRWSVPNERFALSRRIAFLGLSVLAVAGLSCLQSLTVYLSSALAIAAGLSLSYWREGWRSSLLSKIAFALLAVVFTFSFALELVFADWRSGAFADRVAEAILDDMGDRQWIVTDGTIDDHLLLVARSRGRDIHLVSLVRDGDAEYRKSLAALVREQRLAGDASSELVLSLDLGVLPFVQDWLKSDPEVAKKCVIFGAPDLWYAAGVNPVPEMFFFGGDEKRAVDWSRWQEFNSLLEAPRRWGSYALWKEADPIAQLRLNLRRHLGLVANNRGVWLQDRGCDDEAFAMYRLVYQEIDGDNISAMFNILAMASAKYAPAVALRKEIEEKFRKILADKDRRYVLGALARFYGYIRDPQMFVRLGYQWARSGVPGAAMAQIRRAMDLVPSGRRNTLVNMLASLYASENDREKSRAAFQSVLEKDHDNHEALVGMMRLALMDGDEKLALKYLERAVASGGDDPRLDLERAMVAMMKNELAEAATILKRFVDVNRQDARAWSLYAFVLMNRSELDSDEAKRRAYSKELEDVVLPALIACSNDAGDYYVNSVKAFLLLRKGPDHRREARDAFAVAAKARPDIAKTQDIVLGLDISLNDKVNAEAHARETLKLNRQAPLANYVMGSVALGKNDLVAAEAYLKRATDVPHPIDLALNDLAETYRRLSRPEDAVKYAERAVEVNPKLYVARATLASALLDLGRELPRALALMNEAVELSKVDGKVEDPRMFIGLARAQLANGDASSAKTSLRKVKRCVNQLEGFELHEYEEVLRRVK